MPTEKSRVRALIITVHYKTSEGVLALLKSLETLRDFSTTRTIIADNSSGPEYLSKLRGGMPDIPGVEVLELAANRGYFGAARFALDDYLAKVHDLPEWVIVCNHDVVIEDREFLSKLFAEDPKDAAVIAPRIQVIPGRVDQNPFMRRRPGRLRWAWLRLCFSNYGIATIWDWLFRQKRAVQSFLRGFPSTAPERNGREVIYAPHGAFFIFSRKYFEGGGFLDGNLFLYGEEISVAEICRSLGLAVIYEPSLRVLHDEHSSTGKSINRFSYECQKNALEYLRLRYLSSVNAIEPASDPGALG